MEATFRSTRRFDLDWLRFLAVLLLVPFHAALVFVRDPADISYVKDQQESAVLKTAVDLVYQFHMPLLFFIAGAGTWFGLGARGVGAYVRERVLRLLVPYFFGTAVLVPPMLYVQFLWKPGYVDRFRSFWEYYPQYFRVTGDLSGYAGTYTPGHLWFVLFLFCFSVAALLLLLFLRSPVAGSWVAGAAAFASRPGAIFLPSLPILLSMALPSIGGKNPAYYLIFFLLGNVAMAHPSFREEIERRAPRALLVAILCAPALVGWLWPLGRRVAPFTWQSTGVGLVMSLSTWCWVLGLAGLGSAHLRRGGAHWTT